MVKVTTDVHVDYICVHFVKLHLFSSHSYCNPVNYYSDLF